MTVKISAASIFGELWKLEPLSEEKKSKWRKEMDWLLSPTHYMVELVPSKQNGTSGRVMEVSCDFAATRTVKRDFEMNVNKILCTKFLQIMTPKVRGDIHMNLPALQKLDSMLIVGGIFTIHIF